MGSRALVSARDAAHRRCYQSGSIGFEQGGCIHWSHRRRGQGQCRHARQLPPDGVGNGHDHHGRGPLRPGRHCPQHHEHHRHVLARNHSREGVDQGGALQLGGRHGGRARPGRCAHGCHLAQWTTDRHDCLPAGGLPVVGQFWQHGIQLLCRGHLCGLSVLRDLQAGRGSVPLWRRALLCPVRTRVCMPEHRGHRSRAACARRHHGPECRQGVCRKGSGSALL